LEERRQPSVIHDADVVSPAPLVFHVHQILAANIHWIGDHLWQELAED